MNEILQLTVTEENILKITRGKMGKFFKIVVEGIPIVGSIYNGVVGNLEKRSLLVSISEIVDRRIDEKINFNNKEEMEFFTHVIFKSIRCSKESQIKRIIDILQGKYDGTIESFNDAEDLINIVSELSENEARCLFEAYDALKDTGKKAISGEDIKNIPEDQSEYLLTRLAGKALLKIDTAFQPIFGGGETNFSSTKVGGIIFSTLLWGEDN